MKMNPGLFGILFYLALEAGSVTAAGLAFFLGRFLLAAVLLAVAAGVWLRFRRGRRP